MPKRKRPTGERASLIDIHGLAFRVACWFARNHDEVLTTNDIALKFGVPMLDVSTRLNALVEAQVLDRRFVRKMGVYRAGPSLLFLVSGQLAPWAAMKEKSAA